VRRGGTDRYGTSASDRARDRREVPPIGRGDAGESERLGDGDDGRVDEPEVEILEAPVQVRHAPVGVPRQIRDQVIPSTMPA
jgi:hypothetical protein